MYSSAYLTIAALLLLAASGCSPFAPPGSARPPQTVAAPPTLPLSSAGQPTIALRSNVPLCPDQLTRFVTDFRVYQAPALPEPKARVPFRDPVFGSCIVRVTDRKSDLSQSDSSPGIKNEYSRVQAFNADGTRMIARGIEATWYLYDAQTLRPLMELPIDVEPRWDAADPGLIYYFDGGTQLLVYDLRTNASNLVHDFAADLPGKQLAAVWTRYEGSPSLDGRYWGLMAQDQDWNTIAYLVYDRQADRVIGKRALPRPMSVDTMTISPLGNHLLAYNDDYCESRKLGTLANPCGLMVYDRNLQNGRGMLRIVGHTDPALDAQGREVLVYQDIDTDHISMLDLASGAVTPLWPIDYSHSAIGFHFSGRAFRRPGWAVVSTYNGSRPTAGTWMDDQVFLVELKKGGRVLRLAHTHSVYNEAMEKDYWAEPHASANQNLTRILFTSNWQRSGTEEVEMFMIELPPDWPARLP